MDLSHAIPAALSFDDAPTSALRFFSATPELCRALSSGAASLPNSPPNSMHRYGKVLLPDMEKEILGLVRSCLSPEEAAKVYHVHAFHIQYAMGDGPAPRMTKLAKHCDSSDFTINLCCSDSSFTGSDLVFSGFAGTNGAERVLPKEFRYVHRPFRGVVHRGALQHWVEELTSGSRESVIIWVRCGEPPACECGHSHN
jgi:hypothetical protein